jgi:hypothetical protein
MIQNALRLVLGLGISGSLLLGTGFCAEKPKAQNQIEKAIRKYQRLVEAGKQEKAQNLAENTARNHPRSPAAKLLKQHSDLLGNSPSPAGRLAPVNSAVTTQASDQTDTQILAQMLIVDVPDTFFEQLGIDFEAVLPKFQRDPFERIGVDFDFDSPKPLGIEVRAIPQPNPSESPRFELVSAEEQTPSAILSPLEAQFLERALRQGNCQVLSRPQIRTLPTQPATIEMGDSQGLELSVELVADVSKDGKHLTLSIDGKSQDHEAQLKETLPLGKTLLMSLGTRLVEARFEQRVPVLDRVPYVNRLFKNTAIARETRHRLVFITPRLVEEPKSHPVKSSDRN